MAGTRAGGSPRSHPACAGVAGLSSAPGWPGTRPRRRRPRQGEGCECRTRTGSRGFATLHCSTGETSATTRSDGPYHILAGSDGYWVSGRRGPIGRPRFDPRIVYRDWVTDAWVRFHTSVLREDSSFRGYWLLRGRIRQQGVPTSSLKRTVHRITMRRELDSRQHQLALLHYIHTLYFFKKKLNRLTVATSSSSIFSHACMQWRSWDSN